MKIMLSRSIIERLKYIKIKHDIRARENVTQNSNIIKQNLKLSPKNKIYVLAKNAGLIQKDSDKLGLIWPCRKLAVF